MNKKGFTLVEILAVLVILSLLLILTIPSIKNAITNGNITFVAAFPNVPTPLPINIWSTILYIEFGLFELYIVLLYIDGYEYIVTLTDDGMLTDCIL